MIAPCMPSSPYCVFVATGAGPATLDPSFMERCSQLANGTHGNPTDDIRHPYPCLHRRGLRRDFESRTLHRLDEDGPGPGRALQSP